ncbi:type II secretion system protein N [Undibacterium sp. Di26W]|uniref:type II secretion system protein N n=1 Tax=Undibacterium sp. Di26W TaxID=3413035 RepID=UPI003BF3B9C4
MKRLPIVVTFLAFVALCMSLSFWGLRLFKPQARSVSAAFQQGSYEPGAGQWGGIFGISQVMQANASNFQLKGVVLAKRTEESLAIISANGKPGLSVAMNKEVMPGVTLKEVHDLYVVIVDAGVERRIDLPQVQEVSRIQTAPAVINQVSQPNQPIQANMNQGNTVPPQVAPPNSFAAHRSMPAPGGPIAPAAPMVTPGLPTASLPTAMPGNPQ